MITLRDKKILELLDTNRYMSRWAIQTALFDNYSKPANACFKANNRLKHLIDLGKVNRLRWPERNNNYVYFLGKKHDNWQQYAWVNEIAYLLKDSMHQYKHEYVFENIRADGIFLLNTGVKMFVEIDSSNNPFDKPEQYSKLFRGDGWESLWQSFPRILVVTFRPDKVKELIKKNSDPALKWKAITFGMVDRVKEELA